MVTGISTGMGTGAYHGGTDFYGPSGGASGVSGHSRADRIAQQAQEARLATLSAKIKMADIEALRQQGAAGVMPPAQWAGGFYAPSESIDARLNSMTGSESPAALAALVRADVADQWAQQQNYWRDEMAYAAFQARKANMSKEDDRKARLMAMRAYVA